MQKLKNADGSWTLIMEDKTKLPGFSNEFWVSYLVSAFNNWEITEEFEQQFEE